MEGLALLQAIARPWKGPQGSLLWYSCVPLQRGHDPAFSSAATLSSLAPSSVPIFCLHSSLGGSPFPVRLGTSRRSPLYLVPGSLPAPWRVPRSFLCLRLLRNSQSCGPLSRTLHISVPEERSAVVWTGPARDGSVWPRRRQLPVFLATLGTLAKFYLVVNALLSGQHKKNYPDNFFLSAF